MDGLALVLVPVACAGPWRDEPAPTGSWLKLEASWGVEQSLFVDCDGTEVVVGRDSGEAPSDGRRLFALRRACCDASSAARRDAVRRDDGACDACAEHVRRQSPTSGCVDSTNKTRRLHRRQDTAPSASRLVASSSSATTTAAALEGRDASAVRVRCQFRSRLRPRGRQTLGLPVKWLTMTASRPGDGRDARTARELTGDGCSSSRNRTTMARPSWPSAACIKMPASARGLRNPSLSSPPYLPTARVHLSLRKRLSSPTLENSAPRRARFPQSRTARLVYHLRAGLPAPEYHQACTTDRCSTATTKMPQGVATIGTCSFCKDDWKMESLTGRAPDYVCDRCFKEAQRPLIPESKEERDERRGRAADFEEKRQKALEEFRGVDAAVDEAAKETAISDDKLDGVRDDMKKLQDLMASARPWKIRRLYVPPPRPPTP
ncbi:uncharacterized protein MAM_03279 [Metarhizium album ARSEF 1941]|uniref:Uncharacterized protein n=1 Tax=Metarhizium album (strain ARSEF 1941) TaxID=1081103 RepID=A0A0B2WZH6_METAS|nr:uncharacterized protein MAM_03279 [Metarhizium album ARSEF 1941]KHN98817.1 hypothetical protein MAM_03279 [Metarhizium album ARSEF 1941]